MLRITHAYALLLIVRLEIVIFLINNEKIKVETLNIGHLEHESASEEDSLLSLRLVGKVVHNWPDFRKIASILAE